MPSHSHSGTAQSNGAHTHGMTISSQQSAGGSYHIRKTDSPTTETYQTTSAGAHTHTLSINNTVVESLTTIYSLTSQSIGG